MSITPDTIPTALIAALLPLAAKGDVRAYLNGILIEPDRAGHAVLVACDGHVAAIARTSIPWKRGAIIVPRHICEAIAKGKAGTAAVFAGGKAGFTAEYGATTLAAAGVDGRHIEWRALVPHIPKLQEAAFNPSLLGAVCTSAAKLHKALGRSVGSLSCLVNGDHSSVLQLECVHDGYERAGVTSVTYILMPLRAFVPVDAGKAAAP